jgi:NADPH:quinone reductase-like Zn-dependent oxidoreductase
VREGSSVAIAGAQGAVGSTAVQIARARGAHVYESLEGVERADAGFDAAGRGDVPRLIELTGDPKKVATIADFDAAVLGVHVTSQTSAWHALAEVAELFTQGRFSVAVAKTFPLDQAAEAHRAVEAGGLRGKVILEP